MHDPPAADLLQPPRPEEVGFSVRNYELMVILDPELEERTIAPSLDRFLTVVTKAGGTVKTEIWGKRRLAYEIKKQVEGIYRRNLRVLGVDKDENLLVVEGSVPGPNGGYLVITKAKKPPRERRGFGGAATVDPLKAAKRAAKKA